MHESGNRRITKNKVMKELSIEDKARRYDEAIERAKSKIKNDKDHVLYEDDVIEIFPELKESEGKDVKESVVNIVKEWAFRYQIDVESELAWLEKQGEQNIAEISNVCEFSIETWIKIVDYVLTEHNGIGNYLINPEVKDTAEKLQKKYKFDAASEEWDRVYRKGLDAGVNKGRAEALREQKPAEWSLPYGKNETTEKLIALAECLEADGDYLFNGLSGNDYGKFLRVLAIELTQPKQEWTEEDEKAIEDACYHLNRYGNSFNENNQEIANTVFQVDDRLKSLKDRVQPKPMFNEKMDIEVWKSTNGQYVLKVNGNVIRGQLYDDAKLIYRHFFYLSETESLKPQNRWKPSDEQLGALWDSIKHNLHLHPILKSLYNDLKKLMEEKVMNVIEIFGRKLTIVEDNDTNTCKKCALVDICPSGVLPCKDSVGNVNRRFEKVKE